MDDAWMDAFLDESARSMAAFTSSPAHRSLMVAMADRITGALRLGGKLLLAGNGGSAADAQHIAGEIVGRMLFDRPGLPALALTTDSSVLTAVGNDYGFERVFQRQVEAFGRPGDVFLGISTSGRSPNILAALRAARAGGLVTLAFCGRDPGPMADGADLVLAAPATLTPVVQQIHITAAHAVCALVERAMFPDNAPRASRA